MQICPLNIIEVHTRVALFATFALMCFPAETTAPPKLSAYIFVYSIIPVSAGEIVTQLACGDCTILTVGHIGENKNQKRREAS